MRSWLCLKRRDGARWPVLAGIPRHGSGHQTSLREPARSDRNSESIANLPNQQGLEAHPIEQSSRVHAQRFAGRTADLKSTSINSEKAWI